jgi:hypothetical protein
LSEPPPAIPVNSTGDELIVWLSRYASTLSSQELAESLAKAAAIDWDAAWRLAHAERFPARRALALKALYEKLLSVDPKKAITLLRSENLLPDDAVTLRRHLMDQLVSSDPKAWATSPPSWVGVYENADLQRSAMKRWASADPLSAAEFSITSANEGHPLDTGSLRALAKSALPAALQRIGLIKDSGQKADALRAVAGEISNFREAGQAIATLEILSAAVSGTGPGYSGGMDQSTVAPIVKKALEQFPDLRVNVMQMLPPGPTRDSIVFDAALAQTSADIAKSLEELEQEGVPVRDARTAALFAGKWLEAGGSKFPEQIIGCNNEYLQIAVLRHIAATRPAESRLPSWCAQLPPHVRSAALSPE